ncbi:MAG: HlyD family secretion protein, partial [Streptosporangiaceae bacterium]
VPVRGDSYLPATRQQAPVPAVSHSGAVSRSRERVRGMNAALETGVAGVGEMAPARQPARPRQMVMAVLVAAVGLVAGVLTYKSLASGPVSFGGEVVPTHVYALSFGEVGTITAVKVHAGERVTAGEVLVTQDGSLARANLQEARDAEAAAAAALYADQHPQQWSVTREHDSVASAQASLARVTARVSSANSHDSGVVDERRQAVNQDATAYSSQCGTATGSSTCQALAAKLAAAKQELAPAQAAAAADRTAGQQQEQAAQSQLSERRAALQQVESQATGVSVTLDQARQRLAAAKATVAQDEIALEATSIVAPASGTIGAVSAAAGDGITGSDLHNPVVTVDSGPLVVSAQLPGTEIGEVRAGQPVTLDIAALQASLPGKVVQVNQVASQSQTTVSYTVICQTEPHDTRLMAGMTVSITPQ